MKNYIKITDAFIDMKFSYKFLYVMTINCDKIYFCISTFNSGELQICNNPTYHSLRS